MPTNNTTNSATNNNSLLEALIKAIGGGGQQAVSQIGGGVQQGAQLGAGIQNGMGAVASPSNYVGSANQAPIATNMVGQQDMQRAIQNSFNQPPMIRKEKVSADGHEVEYVYPTELAQGPAPTMAQNLQNPNQANQVQGLGTQGEVQPQTGQPQAQTPTIPQDKSSVLNTLFGLNGPGGQPGVLWQILSLMTGHGVVGPQQTTMQAQALGQKIAGKEPIQPQEKESLKVQRYSAQVGAVNERYGRLTGELNANSQQLSALDKIPWYHPKIKFKAQLDLMNKNRELINQLGDLHDQSDTLMKGVPKFDFEKNANNEFASEEEAKASGYKGEATIGGRPARIT